MGPLVQGAARLSDRIKTATLLVVGLVSGAVLTFAVVRALGMVFHTSELAREWRLAVAGGGLLTLAALDLFAIRKATYCPLGWRRQTPQALLHDHPMDVVAAVWGFDIGLAVTTFRVAALTWGALLLVGLGFSPWWTGASYGLAIAVPLCYLLWTHRVGRVSRDPVPSDPGLGAMLDYRTRIQVASVLLLAVAGAALITGTAA